MQRKIGKFISAILAVALCGTAFASCNQDNSVTFSPLWHEYAATAQHGKTEKLTYAVSFEQGSGLGFNYSVDYQNGAYTTTLTSYADEDGSLLYRYETQLTITVVYTCNGQSSEPFTDSVTSWVEFESAEKGLNPLKMHKEVKSHSPVSTTATTLTDSYVYYETTTDIDYTNGTAIDVTVRPDAQENKTTTRNLTVKKQDKYTCLDNEQLLVAIRGINPENNGAPAFSVYTPYTDAAQIIKAQFSSKVSQKIANLTVNGTKVEKEISYYPVSLSIDAKNSGMTQTLHVAAKVTSGANTYRNVVLRYEVPLSLNLGTLTYSLTEAVFM